ncbi:hypothetical protein SAMN06295905_2780 [Devosia lucknowensis]|uniref:Uncharacterized protein n=1 Tax=Devosia lucknowensis TaxID=1096929 RepID=A0A1Y6G5R8_9HYPH|nr:hypothetical protein [Devosia lucknowensis]SMQ85502.1 hypothetical protein SAMN06295905_2780 [Devosia lucknowensis]
MTLDRSGTQGTGWGRLGRLAVGAPIVSTVAALLAATPAHAHVKWFAPYVVGAAPAPISETLANGWFWMGIVLVLVFFAVTVVVERSPAGTTIGRVLDRFTSPLWLRSDDFMRAIIGAFFVAIFAVGGVYLTPDLQTPNEWVSWLQLLIALLVFSRKTMPLAAAGIIGLWVIALRDYDFFHLLDYLALGVGVAGYLALAAFPESKYYQYRFAVLRWGVAIALMWSSLEKFAYAEWFHPLVEERPFLTFGMPRDTFIPMAGVAEFTMGFGLLWTALIRRLSAIALIIIFTAAVYPFGRIDLVGHALIMGTLFLIATDPTPSGLKLRGLVPAIGSVPAGLLAALVIIAGSYWTLHGAFYDYGAAKPVVTAPDGELLTHMPNAEHPHGMAVPEITAQ